MRQIPLLLALLLAGLSASPATAAPAPTAGRRVAQADAARGRPAGPRPAADRLRGVGVRIVAAKDFFLPGEHIPLRVVLANESASTVKVYTMKKAFMSFRVVGPGGSRACAAVQDLPGRVRLEDFIGVRARGRMDKSVYLDGFCGALAPGRWRVELDYRIPRTFDGDGFGLDALTGVLHAETTVTVQAPAPRANLALHLSRPRRTRVGDPLDLEVRLTNLGPDDAFVIRPIAPALELRVTRDGASTACSNEHGDRLRRSDVVFLARGRDLVEHVDLAKRCRIERPGSYTVEASYRVGDRAAGLLPERDRARLWTGVAPANALPFDRQRAEARATLALDAIAPSAVVPVGAPAVLDVRLTNLGPDTVALAPTGTWLDVRLTEESGRAVACLPPASGARPDDGATAVRAGASLVDHVDLTKRCGRLRPGRYVASVRYAVPPTRGLVRAGWGRVSVWSGEVGSRAVPVVVGHRAPPPPPPVAEPARVPSVSLQAPEKVREGRPLPVTLTLTAPEGGLKIARLEPWMVRPTVRDRDGRPLTCRTAPMPRTLPRPRDFVRLEAGQTVSVTVDLGPACGHPQKGAYFVGAQLHVPPAWAGRRVHDGWTGTLDAEVVRVKVRKARGED